MPGIFSFVSFPKKAFLFSLPLIFCLLNFPEARVGEEKKVSKKEAPSWIRAVPDGYFVGMSKEAGDEASARESALKDAQKAIIGFLGIRLESEAIEKMVSSGSDANVKTENAYSKAQVKEVGRTVLKVTDAEYFVEKWERKTEGGIEYFYKAWARVGFSEKDHAKFINETIGETLNTVKKLLDEGKAFEEDGEPVQAVNRYLTARESISGIGEFTGLPSEVSKNHSNLKIESEALYSSLIARLKLTSDQDKLSCFAGDPLEEPLKVQAAFHYNDRIVPARNMQIVFRVIEGKAEIDERKSTDGRGNTSCTVYAVGKEAGRNIIEAEIEWPNKTIKEAASRTRFVVEGIAKSKGVKALVFIREIIDGKTTPGTARMEMKFLEKLKEKDFTILPDKVPAGYSEEQARAFAKTSGADILLYAKTEIGEFSPYGEESHSARARAEIKVFSIGTGEIIFIINLPNDKFKDTRGFGNTKMQAADEALKFERKKGLYEYLAQQITDAIPK